MPPDLCVGEEDKCAKFLRQFKTQKGNNLTEKASPKPKWLKVNPKNKQGFFVDFS
jgi:hypothetical protein